MTPNKKLIPIFSEDVSFHKTVYKDFNISSYKDEPQEALNRVDPHRHTYYEIIWIKKGYGTHLIDFKEYPFEGPCLFILNPGVVHKIQKAVPTEGNVVKFSESFLTGEERVSHSILRYDLFDNINARPVFHLSQEAVQLLDDLMQKMLVEYNQHTKVSRAILLSYLQVFLLQVHKLREYETIPKGSNSPRYQILLKFKKLVEQHYTDQKKLDFYAAEVATSKRNLNEITNTYLGKSASQILKERIVLEAKRLLYSGGLSIKEVAYELGYDDPAYFTRFFHKNTGTTPSEFLQQGL